MKRKAGQRLARPRPRRGGQSEAGTRQGRGTHTGVPPPRRPRLAGLLHRGRGARPDWEPPRRRGRDPLFPPPRHAERVEPVPRLPQPLRQRHVCLPRPDPRLPECPHPRCRGSGHKRGSPAVAVRRPCNAPVSSATARRLPGKNDTRTARSSGMLPSPARPSGRDRMGPRDSNPVSPYGARPPTADRPAARPNRPPSISAAGSSAAAVAPPRPVLPASPPHQARPTEEGRGALPAVRGTG